MNDDRFGVRIGHLIPDAPAVDILVDGYPVLAEREFGDIPDYTEHDAAEYHMSVQRSDTGETILEEPVRFDGGTYHTLLFIGSLAEPEFRLLTDGQTSASAVH